MPCPGRAGALSRWQEPGGGALLLGGGGSVPFPGRQSPGNLRSCAGGSDGGRVAGGGERLGRLPLHRE